MTFSSNDHQLFDGMTPAHFACVEGHADCLTILLEHHADVTKEDDAGYRPVHTACYNGNYGCVEVLLKHGIDANIAESTKGMTPTYICCAIGHVKLLNLLIQHGGVDLDKSNSFDLSPVYVASSLGHIKILSLLIRHHADINKREKINGSTPLDIARLQCNSDVVGLLLENGAVDNPNHTIPYFASSTWKDGHTPMKKAFQENRKNALCCDNPDCTTADFSALDLKRCARCMVATYCGGTCQKAHYKAHKELCKQLTT
jgi:ankyrin repeat protein